MPKPAFHFFLLSSLAAGLIPGSLHAQSLLVVNQGDTNVSIVNPASESQIAIVAEKTTECMAMKSPHLLKDTSPSCLSTAAPG